MLRDYDSSVNVTDESGCNAVMMAAATGRADSVDSFVRIGVNPHATTDAGVTALMLAAQSEDGGADAMNCLMDAGVNLYDCDVDGDNVLAYVNSPLKLKALAQRGFDFSVPVNAKRMNRTPYIMYLATSNFANKADMISVLIRSGVFINAKDRYGCTTLDRLYRMRIDKRDVRIIDFLIAHGATISDNPSPVEWWGTRKSFKNDMKVQDWYFSPRIRKTFSNHFVF
jgi:hypothetical protein